jgi:hypothetical protein
MNRHYEIGSKRSIKWLDTWGYGILYGTEHDFREMYPDALFVASDELASELYRKGQGENGSLLYYHFLEETHSIKVSLDILLWFQQIAFEWISNHPNAITCEQLRFLLRNIDQRDTWLIKEEQKRVNDEEQVLFQEQLLLEESSGGNFIT